jgi:hypothetical protein
MPPLLPSPFPRAAAAAALFAKRCSRTAFSRDETDETRAAKPIGRLTEPGRPAGEASLTTDAGDSGNVEGRGSALGTGRSIEIVKGTGDDPTAGGVPTGELVIATERRVRKLLCGVVALWGSLTGSGCCRVYSREKLAREDAGCRYAEGASVMARETGLGEGSALLTADVRRETIRDATMGCCCCSIESERRRERS